MPSVHAALKNATPCLALMGQASGHMLTSHLNKIPSMVVLDMLDYKLWALEGFVAPGAFQTGKEVTNFVQQFLSLR